MTSPQTHALLRSLMDQKIFVRPDTIARLPAEHAQGLREPLDLARLLLQPLSRAPAPMLEFWANHPRGYAAVTTHRHGYEAGTQQVGHKVLDAVAWVSARRLIRDPRLAWPLAYLLDHLLGSDGRPGERWLSDGEGRSSAWQAVGQRVQRQHRLGYGPENALDDPHAYLAWGMRAFLDDRRSLNVADPGLERLLATTVFDARFWQRA